VTIPTQTPWNPSHLERPRGPRDTAEAGQRRKCNRIELSERSSVAQAGQRRKCNRIDLSERRIVLRLGPQSSNAYRDPGLRSGLEVTAFPVKDSHRTPTPGVVPGVVRERPGGTSGGLPQISGKVE
jgi:hypothetical protein